MLEYTFMRCKNAQHQRLFLSALKKSPIINNFYQTLKKYNVHIIFILQFYFENKSSADCEMMIRTTFLGERQSDVQ